MDADMVADSLDSQEVDGTIQGETFGNSETGLTADSDGARLPLPANSGVIDALDTDGVLSVDTLTKMLLGFGGGGAGGLHSRRYMSPPRSPGVNYKCSSAPSPVTPLELPLSPIQPIKKIRSGGYLKPVEADAVLSGDEMLLGA